MACRFSTILVLVISSFVATAQSGYNNLKAADGFYAKGDYYSAAIYYEKYLESSKVKTAVESPYVVQQATDKKPSKKLSTKPQAIYHLAECYRKLNNYAKAVPYYTQVSANTAEFPLAAYWQGISLRALEKYDSSLLVLQKFSSTYTANDEYATAAKKEIANLQFIQDQSVPGKKLKYNVAKAAANKEGATYAPTWNKDQLVITSTTPDSTVKLPKNASPYNNKLYTVNGAGFTKLNMPNADSKQYGVASFTADGKKAFLTRWNNMNGKNISAIYTSELKDTVWTEPVLFDSTVNVRGFSAKQPFVSNDGSTLFFSSDMPGGKGKFDLYSISLKPGAMPMNLQAVNTDGDDEAPYYHAGTLVFASNGRVGMGGFDLYYAKGNTGSFATPINFGKPINSIKDDIYFTAKPDGKSGLFLASDRASECCLQLFNVERIPTSKFITGKIVDCNTKAALAAVAITVMDSATSAVAFNLQTNANGEYSLVVPEYKAYSVKAEKAGYNNSFMSFNAPYDTESDTLYNADLCLIPIPPPPPVVDSIPPTTTRDTSIIVLNAVYFDFDKHNLTAESKATLDQVVKTMKDNPSLVVEVNGHADEKGTDLYNLDLSMKRAKICFDYLVSKGIKVSRLQLKASGESDPVAPNSINGVDNPEGRKLNRRAEFKVPKK